MAEIAAKQVARAALHKPRLKRRRWEEPEVALPFRIGAWVAFVVLLLPAVIVVLSGLNSGDTLTFPPEGISGKWVIAFLQSDILFDAYVFSLWLALITMAIATVLGTMVAIFLSRVRFVGRDLMRAYFISPLILPGIVLGLALLLFYNQLGFSRTLVGLLIGHILVTTPYVIGTVSAALAVFDPALEEAARSLGAGPFKAFRKVTMPIIGPNMIAGSIFAFIVSFGQFDVSLFLSMPNRTPLPIALYVSLRYKFEPTAAAAGIFAILLVIVSLLITAKLVNMKKFGGIKFT